MGAGMSIEVPVVMQDRGAAIAMSDDMTKGALKVERRPVGHERKCSG